jgi:hypothetical protein
LLFEAERMFIGETEPGAGSNRIRWITCRNRGASRYLMSCIDDGINCAELVDNSDSLTGAVHRELRSEKTAGPILLS